MSLDSQGAPQPASTVASGGEPRQQRSLGDYGLTAAWLINLALLMSSLSWICIDGRFMRPVATISDPAARSGAFTIKPMSAGRMTVLWGIALVAIASLAPLFAGLFLGTSRHRRIRSWLALTALVAAWLGVLTAWPEIAWAGQRWRVSRQLVAFQSIASSLAEHWPTQDGSTEWMGPFSAYPFGDPQVLLPLTTRTVGDIGISAVERSPMGALRFQLTGREEGAWLELHPAGDQPTSFVGGLETDYELVRSSALGGGWFLTRYQSRLADAAKSAP